jgi:hypothetical protein
MIQAADSVVIASDGREAAPRSSPWLRFMTVWVFLLSRSMDLGLHRAKCHGSLKYGTRIRPGETKSETPVNSEKRYKIHRHHQSQEKKLVPITVPSNKTCSAYTSTFQKVASHAKRTRTNKNIPDNRIVPCEKKRSQNQILTDGGKLFKKKPKFSYPQKTIKKSMIHVVTHQPESRRCIQSKAQPARYSYKEATDKGDNAISR